MSGQGKTELVLNAIEYDPLAKGYYAFGLACKEFLRGSFVRYYAATLSLSETTIATEKADASKAKSVERWRKKVAVGLSDINAKFRKDGVTFSVDKDGMPEIYAINAYYEEKPKERLLRDSPFKVSPSKESPDEVKMLTSRRAAGVYKYEGEEYMAFMVTVSRVQKPASLT